MPSLIWGWKKDAQRSNNQASDISLASLQSLRSEKGEPLGAVIETALNEFFVSLGPGQEDKAKTQ